MTSNVARRQGFIVLSRNHSQFTPLMRKLLVMFDGFVIGDAAPWAAGLRQHLKDTDTHSIITSEPDVHIVIPNHFEDEVYEFLGSITGFDAKYARFKDDYLNLEVRIGDVASMVVNKKEFSSIRFNGFYHFNSDSYYLKT